MPKDKAEFVQIMFNYESLFALDSDGRVWEFDVEADEWCLLTDSRNDDTAGDN
jgi:hypothetical protein